jgi:energy-coupling factor transport system permease protein
MGVAAWLTGQDGFSYFVRMTAVLIIASWMYAERYQGEFLDLGVWFFGDRIVFDLGLIGELSISALEELGYEIERITVALSQKGEKLRPVIIPAVFSSLLMRQLVLSHDRACLLATRGYQGGGTHNPVFHTSLSEGIAGAFAVVILMLSVFSRDLFIIICQTYTV